MWTNDVASVAALAETSLRSPRKLFMFIIKTYVSKKALSWCNRSDAHVCLLKNYLQRDGRHSWTGAGRFCESSRVTARSGLYRLQVISSFPTSVRLARMVWRTREISNTLWLGTRMSRLISKCSKSLMAAYSALSRCDSATGQRIWAVKFVSKSN